MQKIIKISKKVFLIVCSVMVMLIGTSCEIVSNTNTEEEVYALEVQNDKGVNNQGVLTVTGDVKNISDLNITSLIVKVTFYDGSMNELVTQTVTSEDILLPDESYHFKVNCLKKEASSYSIDVQGFSN